MKFRNFCSATLALATVTSAALVQAGTPDLSSCNSWMPACTSNYTASSRPSAYPIQYVVIHKVQGTAAGSASWFQNCSSGVTAHYNFDNSSGYCYQSVREKDIAWHAANWTYNSRGIGIEHGGYVTSNDTSNACYRASGLETRSCIIYYNVTWDRSHIVGHSEVPGADHTDPGIYWNWSYYMSCSNVLAGGAIRDKWLDLGGGAGVLGNPTTGELACPDGVGRFNHFNGAGNNASIYWTPSTGAHEVHGAIHQKWQALNWETGVCGYPITDESTCPDGVGKFNHFSKGASIYWTSSTGAHEVGGAIRNKWEALGWETGICGYPTTDESPCQDGVGRYNHFSKNASIYYTPTTGAHSVNGAIRNKWASMGYEASSLGYPTSDEYAVAGGRRSDFQNGTITWHADTNTVSIP